MKPNIKRLYRKYMDNPSNEMTSENIHWISEDDLLDID